LLSESQAWSETDEVIARIGCHGPRTAVIVRQRRWSMTGVCRVWNLVSDSSSLSAGDGGLSGETNWAIGGPN